ncbi:MAG TPA: serine hydrolase domain-containing protein, partial [Ideonella sp.]|uniref:serine hydrolase domain-containing protein n=1 Tax=Ideonella sp. TaxID=1929293 RepID=UPI002B52A9F6
MTRLHVLFSLLLACAASLAQAADPTPAAIDRLFATWDKPDSPGVALAVVRDGKIAYSRGYGMANLEYGVANSPTTVFHVASVSKQFTAFAIHLLASDGKLSLDDEVRKHLPELAIQGPPITIRQLLHHTSGLRDQWDLLTLAGLRLDDGITENDILGLLWQQKELNFPPGEELLYSNSGYSLLGLIVRRVSGQSLAAFT